MNVLDYGLIIAALAGAIMGFKMGLVKQMSFGVGLAVGLFQAIHSYSDVSKWITDITGWSEGICITIAFVLILVVIMTAVFLVGVLLSKIIKIVLLGPIDKILGMIFAIYFFVTTLAAIVDISGWIAPENAITGKTAQEESLLYKEIAGTTYSVIEEAIK